MTDTFSPPQESFDAPTYFDRPMLKAPHWEWNVTTYLFLGGIMGGLGILSCIARDDRPDERRMRRNARIASFALAAINPALLISHLGRPERFLHMLRIVKFKSPMSLGVWGLVAYSAVAGASVVRDLAQEKRIAPWLRYLVPGIVTPLHGLLGAFIGGYTGVLLSATANPLWSAGKRHIPSVSVCSGVASACALSSVFALADGNDKAIHKLERLEMLAGLAELGILLDFKRVSGRYGKPMFEGSRGERLQTITMIAGIAAPLALNLLGSAVRLPKPVNTLRTIAASALTLIGGYVLRETLIEGGKASALDPQVAFVQPL